MGPARAARCPDPLPRLRKIEWLFPVKYPAFTSAKLPGASLLTRWLGFQSSPQPCANRYLNPPFPPHQALKPILTPQRWNFCFDDSLLPYLIHSDVFWSQNSRSGLTKGFCAALDQEQLSGEHSWDANKTVFSRCAGMVKLEPREQADTG